MNRFSQLVKVNAVYVVKNEWPLLAVTISHALTHYADKVIIMDTGSEDGTFEGIKILQSLWVDRIDFYRCNQQVYDQEPLTNLLIELSQNSQADWTMVLDADEFFVHSNYGEFFKKLSETQDNWSSYAIKVINFIVDEKHRDSDLADFEKISYRIVGQNLFNTEIERFAGQVITGELPLQTSNTPDKILVRNSSSIFLSQGAHQVVFGDGIFWMKHDSTIASANYLGGIICHLPYTSKQRIQSRKKRSFFDQAKTTSRLNIDAFKSLDNTDLLSKAVLTPENYKRWLESGAIVRNSELSETLVPVIKRLKTIWPKLIRARYIPIVANTFPDALDIKTVSNIIRKYHSRAQSLWDKNNS